MVTKKLIATGVLVCALSTHAWCSPASTEYVKASIDALRTELNAQIKALNTGVGLMNPLILNEHKNSFDLINIVQNNDKKLLHFTFESAT